MVDTQEFAKLVEKSDEGNWKQIVTLAEEQGLKLSALVEEMQQTFNEPFLQAQPELARYKHVSAIYLRKLISNTMVKSEMFEFLVVGSSGPSPTKSKKMIANVHGIAKKANNPDDEPRYAKLAFFEEHISKFGGFQVGKQYTVKCSGGIKGSIYALSATAVTNFGVEIETPTPADIGAALEHVLERVPIGDVGNHLSEKGNYNDVRLIRGGVVFAPPPKTNQKSGQVFASMSVIDDTMDAETVRRGGFRVSLNDVSHAKYGVGAELYFIGTITKREYNGETTIGMYADCVVPILAYPGVQTSSSNNTTSKPDEPEFIEI